MSTRANIIFKDNHTTLYFYRHSDGYPEECGKDLIEFVKGYSKHLRNDAQQSAGHLIVLGNKNMEKYEGYEWKVGDYEPTSSLHSDVNYIYVIDLVNGVLEMRETLWDKGYWDNPSLELTKVIKTKKFKMKE